MDSAHTISLPSFGSTSSTSYAVPKLRVSRWNSTNQPSHASGSGSTTIPVDSRDGTDNGSEVEQGNNGERHQVYPLSSEGELEPQPERPALRLRNIMDRMGTQPYANNDLYDNGGSHQKASSAPSILDSDLESISPSVMAGESAQGRLRDAYTKAMIPPVGNTPQKMKQRVLARRMSAEGMQGSPSQWSGRRKSLSDEEVSCELLSLFYGALTNAVQCPLYHPLAQLLEQSR